MRLVKQPADVFVRDTLNYQNNCRNMACESEL